MLIYNVTAHVEFKVEKEWLLWMKQKHLSEILATKKFSKAKIFKIISEQDQGGASYACLLYTSPSPRDGLLSRMPSSA